MITEEIENRLINLCDKKYREFQLGLLPALAPEAVIGVRTPALRACAKEISSRPDLSGFLTKLPHRYFEENQIHAFLISEMRDYDACVAELYRFLPFVDNWATCDQMSPKTFKKHRGALMTHIRLWLSNDRPFTVRFAIKMLMEHFLDEDFDPVYPTMVAGVRLDEYYVKTMIAWYFATALAKQYDAVSPFIQSRCLEPWTRNKAIQKARESRRLSPEQKEQISQWKTEGNTTKSDKQDAGK